MNGRYLSAVPPTMGTFGTILYDVVATYGVPSFVSIVAETGIYGVIISIFLIVYLYRNSHPSFIGYSLFCYVLLLAVYMPIFLKLQMAG